VRQSVSPLCFFFPPAGLSFLVLPLDFFHADQNSRVACSSLHLLAFLSTSGRCSVPVALLSRASIKARKWFFDWLFSGPSAYRSHCLEFQQGFHPLERTNSADFQSLFFLRFEALFPLPFFNIPKSPPFPASSIWVFDCFYALPHTGDDHRGNSAQPSSIIPPLEYSFCLPF